MKRCSQCDFIYEDDQHACDMDGHELVYEPTLQHPLSAAKTTTETAALPSSSRVRHQALAAAVAVLIAILLSVGYSGFTREYAPQTKAPSTGFIRPSQLPPANDQNTAPAITPTATPGHPPQSERTNSSQSGKTGVKGNSVVPPARSTPPMRPTVPKRDPARMQSSKANHKKESGIGGFFKKTGRILKKPFKL